MNKATLHRAAYPLMALALTLALFGACKKSAAPTSMATPTDPPPNVRFAAYDGDPKRVASRDMSFQIDSPDHKQPSAFLKLGDRVPGTHFRLSRFEYKTRRNPQTGDEEDASELTLISIMSPQTVVLTLPKPINSPPTF